MNVSGRRVRAVAAVPVAVDPDALALGQKIRAVRTDVGLTLDAVAKRVGVSRSLLSQVERGLVQPSLSTLRAIAAALEIQLASLFLDGPGHPSTATDEARFVVRADARKRLPRDTGDVQYELLTPDNDRQTQFMRAVYAPGGSSPPEEGRYVAHEGEESCSLVAGELTFLLGVSEHPIVAGDSISFDANTPHRVVNRRDEPAEV